MITDFLLKQIPKNQSPAEHHTAVGRLAGRTGIICNVGLFAVKLLAGLLTGSISIMADAINNLSDAASSIVTLLGFRLAMRPADREHPYGHARYEYLSGLVVAALILAIGLELGKSSLEKIVTPSAVSVTTAALVLMLVSIGVKIWMSAFYRKLGKSIHSSTLLASAADSRNDVIATSAVVAGLLVNRIWGINLDGWLGLAVAVFIVSSGVGIVQDTVSPLLGKRADHALMESLEKLLTSHDKVLGIHDLLIHDYGPGQCYASVHVEISADVPALECHDIIDDMECDAMEELNVHLVIHYDPVLTDNAHWNEMRQVVTALVAEVNPRLSIHDFRIVPGAKQEKLVFDLAVPYDLDYKNAQLQKSIQEKLEHGGYPYQAVIHFDRTP